MRLTKSEAQYIINKYKLGKVRRIKKFKQGWVNNNFHILTEKGEYVMQISGKKLSKNKKQKLQLQFEVLSYLKEKEFPYDFPLPIRNKKGEYLVRYNKKPCWIYPYISGKIINKLAPSQIKEVGKALGQYHILMKNFKTNYKYVFEKYKYFNKQFQKLTKIIKNRKIDILVKKSYPFIYSMHNKIKERKYKINVLPCHSDFNKSNLLFNNNKLTGIIDFDNITLAPRASDVALGIRRLGFISRKIKNNQIQLFLEGYESVWSLTKKEKEILIPLMIRDCCDIFCWFYTGFTKYPSKKLRALKDIISELKILSSQEHITS